MFSKPLNIAVAIFLVLFTAIYMYTSNQRDKYAQSAIPWLEKNLPAITTWEVEQTWSRLAPEVKQIVDRNELDKIINQYELMGVYQGMEDPEFSRVASAFSIFGSDPKINYTALLHFTQADAILTITLVQRQGEFMIYNLNLGEMSAPDEG